MNQNNPYLMKWKENLKKKRYNVGKEERELNEKVIEEVENDWTETQNM